MTIDASGDVSIDGVSLRSLPKVSLHDHLDGAIRPATIIELARDAGVDAPAADADGLVAWMLQQTSGGSLESYLEVFRLTTDVTQTREALVRVAREYVEDLAADGVVYGEVRWAPQLHVAGGLSLEDAVDAVREGLEAGEDAASARGHDIRVNQLLSAMRNQDDAVSVARLAVANRGEGVVGFDIAGPEAGYPASGHREAFDYLAENFFPTTVHAGEGDGVESIRSALVDGRAMRLGHGVRLAEDLTIVDRDAEEVRVQFGDVARWVRDREIPLELSPSSNVQTGAIAEWGDQIADHPFDLLYQLGFAVTVNTDNRTMSRTSLTRELALLVEAFGYDLEDIEAFQLNAAAAAFLSVEEREELIEIIGEGFDV
ncbi:adenosine deaminase [Microbacterium gorillae]|uniref:adenosine deaminase n=1 Tax=Microbacterium gorillae TaxID=1231063 RepID=UPI00058D471D|nr:adenosine deaminase [Microbacterium gorillae]